MLLSVKFMNKPIRNYEDLLAEEQRLLQHIKFQEVRLREDIAGLKESLKPVGNVMKVMGKITTRDNTGPILNFGLDFGVDLIIRRILLARAGWLTKIVIPFIVKNYSSHIINEEKRARLTKKIQDIFKKIRPKSSKATA
jgi:hypothetical protein